jgi:hypothetical protein
VASSSGGWGAGVVEPWDVRVLLKYSWVAQHLVPLGQQLCHKLIMGCWPEEAIPHLQQMHRIASHSTQGPNRCAATVASILTLHESE